MVEKIRYEWASTGTRVTPGSSKIELGWINNEQVPHEWLNYIQNQSDAKINELIDFVKAGGTTAISNWRGTQALSPSPTGSVKNAIWSAPQYHWICLDGTDMWIARDAYNWIRYQGGVDSNAPAIGTMSDRSLSHDTALTMFAYNPGPNGIWYSTDLTGGIWNIVDTGGTSASISKIATKYPDSDYTVAVKYSGEVRIATTGILNAWTGATTSPTFSTDPKRLIYAGGTKWILLTSTGTSVQVHISNDDGDTWGQTPTPPPFLADNATAWDLDYNRDSGRIVTVGETGGYEGVIYYSDNDGNTWLSATLNVDGPPPGPSSGSFTHFNTLKYLGNRTWVAGCSPFDADKTAAISFDDGVNWRFADGGGYLSTIGSYSSLAYDGKKVIIVSSSGQVVQSLANANI